MIWVVLDANVFISAVLSPRGVPAKILIAWRTDQLQLLTSPPILQEIERVLCYPKLIKRHKWTREQSARFISDLARLSVQTPGVLTVNAVAADPTDNVYLACAIEGDADYLVSGDQHLLQLKQYHGVPILTPKEFTKVLALE